MNVFIYFYILTIISMKVPAVDTKRGGRDEQNKKREKETRGRK